jgi:UDP:flavonoid glycosyltransferase YjiC (YdhE family)
MAEWWNSPLRILGMFPPWFFPPQPDWPSQLRLTGFPLYSEEGVTPASAEVAEFLGSGSPPIVFTPGSANVFGAEFFAAAADACQRLGRRGLLLTRFPEQIPTNLPATVRHFDFVPFGWLIPRAAALVHHGGVGTMSQALAAGVPQVIMPLAFDQHDNAHRCEKLGVSRTLPPSQFRGPALAGLLGELLDNSHVAANCQEAARQLAGQDGLSAACDELERAWAEHHQRTT